MMNYEKPTDAGVKREWRRPELTRFAADEAESSHGNTPDGGGGNQGS